MNWLRALHVSWREILDIAIVAYLFHRAIILVKGTRAVSIIHGMILVLILYYASGELGLYTLHWLLTNFLSSFFLVIIILFQADIRKALSEMGAGWPWKRMRQPDVSEIQMQEIMTAIFHLAKTRTGAIIVFERKIPLGDVIQRGTQLSAPLNKDILLTVFNTHVPLHDGAVVVREGKLAAAGCILPLAVGVTLDAAYGTRHRAALGITQETDAVAVVVSEERGAVSVARQGSLSGTLDEDGLRENLLLAMQNK